MSNSPPSASTGFTLCKSNDVFPLWQGKSATTSREAIPVELSISPNHANRSVDSYVIDIGEIMSQRREEKVTKIEKEDLKLKYIFKYYHFFFLYTS